MMRPNIDTCAATCMHPFGWWHNNDDSCGDPNTFIKTNLIPYEENVQTCPNVLACQGTICSKCTRPIP
jgi:hypothetical protein